MPTRTSAARRRARRHVNSRGRQPTVTNQMTTGCPWAFAHGYSRCAALRLDAGCYLGRLHGFCRPRPDELMSDSPSPEEGVKALYGRALSREPTSYELARFAERAKDRDLKDEQQARRFYEDVLWALLNATEFSLITERQHDLETKHPVSHS